MDKLPIHDFLEALRQSDGSDLHLSPGHLPHVRKNGILRPLADEALSEEQIRSLLEPITPERSRAAWDAGTPADFAYEANGAGRFRVNAYRSRRGRGAVIRAVPRELPSAEDLGLPTAVHDLVRLRGGLVLVTGKAGEGKSTTLAWLVDQVNQLGTSHIVTIEDPVEFEHVPQSGSVITQRELGEDVPTVADALKGVLRQDPDMIVVGEIRDPETLALALTLSETGHLVVGTMHASSAPLAVSRIMDMVETHRQPQTRRQLAECFQAVVAQRLLPRMHRPGRIAAFEVLLRTDATANMIRTADGDLLTPMSVGGSGMQSMDFALACLAIQQEISPELATQLARRPDHVRALIGGEAFG
ncbi:MAG TPA: PilT/PilU family type 4a pilus ATPase [Streptomyces sp.]|nr:PilT/PilU family type 4a pilus ATPase [Streptomyces sp.]